MSVAAGARKEEKLFELSDSKNFIAYLQASQQHVKALKVRSGPQVSNHLGYCKLFNKNGTAESFIFSQKFSNSFRNRYQFEENTTLWQVMKCLPLSFFQKYL